MRFLSTFILTSILFISNISCGKDAYFVYNLATDMIMETDVVFSGGFRSELSLSDLKDCDPYTVHVAEIHNTHPLLSWMIHSDKPGVYQTKYRILVSKSLENLQKNDGEVWDSGLVADSNSVCVPYGGKSLEPSTIYYWKVCIVDSKGRKYDYSSPKGFVTAAEMDGYTSVLPLQKFKQQPVSICKRGGSLLMDFGADYFGQLFLRLNSFTGQKDNVVIHIGENLDPDGMVDQDPDGLARYVKYVVDLIKGYNRYSVEFQANPYNTDPNVNGGAVPVLMPKYIGEVMPFRYVQIDDYSGPILYSNISRDVVTYPFSDDASYFECSDTIINKVWNLCKHTVKATSFAGLFVDGDRERIAYEADAYVALLSHFALDYQPSIDRNTLERLMYHSTWPTEWILMTLQVAYNYYLYTGDISFLEKFYDDLKLRTLHHYRNEDNLLLYSGEEIVDTYLLDNIHSHSQRINDIVDWPSVERDGYSIEDCNVAANAYYYQALVSFSKIAEAVGNFHDGRVFAQLAANTRDSINRNFLDSTSLYVDNLIDNHLSLHGNLFPLAFGIVPDSCKAQVMEYVRSKGMACSVFIAQFLLETLFECNMESDAIRLMADTSQRSWYGMILNGATITTEAWNSEIKENMDWNHVWGSSPVNVITRYLMGIKPLRPGFAAMEIRPQLGNLSHARIKTPTPRGPVEVSVSKSGNGDGRMVVSVPPNSTAYVYLPNASKPQVVSSGEHVFKL